MKKVIAITLVSSMLLAGCNDIYRADLEETTEDRIAESFFANHTENTDEEVLGVAESIPQAESSVAESNPIIANTIVEQTRYSEIEVDEPVVDFESFSSLSDPDLLNYIEDEIYVDLVANLASDDYSVVNVNAIYVSQEYLEELAYNSQKNIYFGYTLEEIEAQYGDAPYCFTLGEDGTTTVQIIEASEDNYNEIVRNVAIGTGVILVCVTVAVATGGTLAGPSAAAGTVLINSIFATAASTAAEYAVGGAVISGLASGIITGYQTGDYQRAIDAGVLAASNGFMWGAISGAIIGGIEGFASAPRWVRCLDDHPTWWESEDDIINYLHADSQVSFLGGEEVDMFTPGATRPDGIIRNADGSVRAIEVKNYDLEQYLSELRAELRRQIGQRVNDLPSGSTQEIVLDVRGRGYSTDFLENTVRPYLRNALSDIYPDIPITFFGG